MGERPTEETATASCICSTRMSFTSCPSFTSDFFLSSQELLSTTIICTRHLTCFSLVLRLDGSVSWTLSSLRRDFCKIQVCIRLDWGTYASTTLFSGDGISMLFGNQEYLFILLSTHLSRLMGLIKSIIWTARWCLIQLLWSRHLLSW